MIVTDALRQIEIDATPEIIDVHAHFLPDAYRAALRDAGLTSLDGGMAIPDWSTRDALALMDTHGVATSILSVSSPGLNFVHDGEEAALVREINLAGAEVMAAHPGRFGAFATLPFGDTTASLQEIEYSLDHLGLNGIILETNHRGVYPGAEGMQPILAELNARQACVFIHPTSPTCHACLLGRAAPLIEFPFETTRVVVDLIYSGTLLSYPDIRFILAHGGGTLPFLAPRIAGFTLAAPASANGLTPPAVMAQLAKLYYDTALAATPVQLGALRQLVPATQILFGSDWPFSPTQMFGGSLAFLQSSSLFDAEERRGILADNAKRLLLSHPRGDVLTSRR